MFWILKSKKRRASKRTRGESEYICALLSPAGYMEKIDVGFNTCGVSKCKLKKTQLISALSFNTLDFTLCYLISTKTRTKGF